VAQGSNSIGPLNIMGEATVMAWGMVTTTWLRDWSYVHGHDLGNDGHDLLHDLNCIHGNKRTGILDVQVFLPCGD